MSGVKNQATNSAISLLFDGILSITTCSYQLNICFWLCLRIFSLFGHELFNGAFSEMEYSLVIVLIKFPLNATDALNGNHKALMKVQNGYHCPSKCRTVTVSANWHKQAYVISLKYMYTYGLYNSKGTVLRCVSCLYKSQYFLLDFLLNIFFSVTFLIMRYHH